MTRERALLGLVLLAAALAYGPALAGTFVFDDLHSVRDNPGIHPANGLRFFWDASLFSSLEARMYRPVLLGTFALNASFGMHALPFKLTDLLLHMGCAGLLFGIVRRWCAEPWRATVAGLWFAVHPLASEAVNMVSARSEQLLVFALLLGLWIHDRARAAGRTLAWGSAACAFLACGAKETGVLLPVLLLVLEALRAPAGAPWLRAALIRLAPAICVVVVYLVARKLVLGLATAHLPVLTGGADVHTGGGRDLLTQLATMCLVLPRALGQMLLPIHLSLDPPIPYARSFALPVVWGGLLCIAMVTWLGLRAWRTHPLATLGTTLAWCCALPWVLIPLNAPLCEHRLYGPLAGIACIVVACWPARLAPVRARLARLLPALAGLAMLGASAWRSLDYRSEEHLWRIELARGNPSPRAWFGVALAEYERGDLHAARRSLERALQHNPRHVPALRTLVEAHLALGADGDPFTALVLAERLAGESPRNPFYHLLRSRTLRAVGEQTGDRRWFDAAVEAALHCLQVAEPKGLVYRTAADARRAQGDLPAAIALLDESIARGLDHLSVRVHRGRLLVEAGRLGEAAQELTRALQQAPFDAEVQAFAAELSRAKPPR